MLFTPTDTADYTTTTGSTTIRSRRRPTPTPTTHSDADPHADPDPDPDSDAHSDSTPTPTPTPTPASTSPVTVTAFQVEKVVLPNAMHKKQKALVLFVQFSGALSTTAAENLAGYTVFSGKTKKVHKVSEVLYNKLVPLTESVYNAAADTVILVPRGKHALPKLEQLQVNVSVLTDPMGRPINNGKNFNATVTNSGFIVSTRGAPATGLLRRRPLMPCSSEEWISDAVTSKESGLLNRVGVGVRCQNAKACLDFMESHGTAIAPDLGNPHVLIGGVIRSMGSRLCTTAGVSRISLQGGAIMCNSVQDDTPLLLDRALAGEVLALRHFEHLSNDETALLLGLTTAAASNRYVQALKRLKEILSSIPGLNERL